ncbi:MAG TPA: Rieske 2Fe-2S domain-containing protein [Alphaproteobacteria bacterium]|jgi:phenylpropionate dioxygenase-like ring-hydroxylating dioxygenase large terminal subunit
MDAAAAASPAALVEDRRVHRRVYTDPAIFALERRRIFGRAWLYVGHESQVPAVGDFFTTALAGQPVVMVRQADGGVLVLFNRCAHRAAIVAPERCGHTETFRCAYHGWTYRLDGALQSIPRAGDYAGTGFERGAPESRMRKLPRVAAYRGFVFASLADTGPDLAEFLGPAAANLDNMVERAPEGALEIAGGCFQTLQRNNWKIYLENLHDGAHAAIVHQSSFEAAKRAAAAAPDALTRFRAEVVAANSQTYEQMEALEVACHGYGHSDMKGFRRQSSREPEYLDYVARLESRLGAERAAEVLDTQRHNAMFYPGMSVHPVFMQLRVILPLAPELTRIDIWVLRMKGAPDWMHRRNIAFANTVHSPSSIVKADDLEAYARVQGGAAAEGGDWVSLHRGAGAERPDGAGTRSTALSEAYIRNQYRAWSAYMDGAP